MIKACDWQRTRIFKGQLVMLHHRQAQSSDGRAVGIVIKIIPMSDGLRGPWIQVFTAGMHGTRIEDHKPSDITVERTV